MYPSGSTYHHLSPARSEPQAEDYASEDDEIDIGSPTLICPECQHTFPYLQRATFPSTLSQIRSRYVPFPEESARIQMLIDEVEYDLTRYTCEIRHLVRIIRKLARQRDQLDRYQREHITLLSPVRRLPPEILTRIFEYHCVTPIYIRHNLTVIAPALSLSQVCSFWRGLVLSLPLLWSSLDIDLGSRHSYGRAQLVQQILANSGSAPLTLDLNVGYGIEDNHLLASALLEHSHRWETVVYDASYASSEYDFGPAPLGLPLLRSLTIRHTHSFSMFKEARALQHLTLDNVTLGSFEDAVPCGQVISVTLRRQSTVHAMTVLQSTPRVQNLILDHIDSQWHHTPGPSVLPNVQLNYLTSLTVSTYAFEEFFIHINAPALISLAISPPWNDRDYSIEFPQTTFLAFLRRSSPDGDSSLLEELRLDRVELADLQLLAILDLTPRLKSLMIREYSSTWSTLLPAPPSSRTITNYLLRALTIPQHSSKLDPTSASSSSSTSHSHPTEFASILVPKLHTIDFVAHPASIDYGLLMDMVASRSQLHMFTHMFNSEYIITTSPISPIRNVSVRQGWLPYPINEPTGQFTRPLVNLEPVFLDNVLVSQFREANPLEIESNRGTFVDDPGKGPDPALLADYEIAHRRSANSQVWEGQAETGDWTDTVRKIKEKAVKCLWWGGSMTTPEFSFVRLVAGVF